MILTLRRLFGLDQPRKSSRKRSYNGARVGRDLADWIVHTTSADAEIRRDMRRLRDRARDLERNNDHARRYLSLLENNVLGARGIGLQMKSRNQDGTLDIVANKRIEEAWREWRKWSKWREKERLILRSVARDGEVFLLFDRGAPNPFRFDVRVLEADYIDEQFFRAAGREGPEIRMGVEIDGRGAAVGYWLFEGHPGDEVMGSNSRRRRVSARDGLLVLRRERPGQTRGVTWMSSGIARLRQLDGYAEAEVIAARAGACQMGFLEREHPNEFPDPDESETSRQWEAVPGSVQELPPGYKFSGFSPDHPNGNFADFQKAQLRAISAGFGVDYHALSNDLEGVSFSSIRSGVLEAREAYMGVQEWLCEEAVTPVFESWLEMALLSPALNLPFSRYDKFCCPEWKARRWPWVDPEKDVNASILSIGAGLRSRRSIISEQGGDYEETVEEIAEDREIADSLGLQFEGDAGVDTVEEDNTDEDEDSEGE